MANGTTPGGTPPGIPTTSSSVIKPAQFVTLVPTRAVNEDAITAPVKTASPVSRS